MGERFIMDFVHNKTPKGVNAGAETTDKTSFILLVCFADFLILSSLRD